MKDLLQIVCERLVERFCLDESKVELIDSFSHPDLVEAVRLFMFRDPTVARKKLEMTGEPLVFDGRAGPAVWESLNEYNHCGCNEEAAAGWVEPALGSGNHAGCHGVAGFHTSLYLVDSSRRPSHISAQDWREILRISQSHGDEIGRHKIWVDSQTHENVITGEKVDVAVELIDGQLSFDDLSGQTIGLALVPDPGQSCGTKWIWAKVDRAYNPANLLSEFPTLVDHEVDGHNGSMRFSGGNAHVVGQTPSIMSPSIQRGLRGWKNDPAWQVAAKLYGGQQHPGWGTTPDPEPPDPEPPRGDKPGVNERLSSVFEYNYGGETMWASIRREFDRPGG